MVGGLRHKKAMITGCIVGGPTAMFRCEAVYRGCRAVLGAQSSSTLTLLVDHLLAHHQNAQHDNSHAYTKLRRERCQLQCDDERLQVTPIRKDEGFESDSDSSGSTCDESFCGNQDIKVISDHVLRLDHLIHHDTSSTSTPSSAAFASSSSSSSDDTSSSATSSGNESEDETPRTTSERSTSSDCLVKGSPAQNDHSQVEVGGGPNPVGSNTVSGGGAIGDTFLMSDILYCHVAPATPRVVVVVVKDADSSQVYAHVFQCLTEEAARALYAHYKEASNKYKLNRYRNSKRKSDQNLYDVPTSNSATVYKSGGSLHKRDGASSSGKSSSSSSGKPPSGLSNSLSKASNSLSRLNDGGGSGGGGRGSLRSIDTRLLKSEKRGGGDFGNNVNVIEVKEPPQQDDPRPWNLVQHTDANGVTHIEIESGPCSLVSSSSDASEFNSLLSLNSQGQRKMNSLTAIPTHKTDIADSVAGSQGSNSCPTSLITTEREILVAGELADKKSRQRQPPQFLKEEKYALKNQIRRHDDKKSNEDHKAKRNDIYDYRREEKRNKDEGHRDEGRREERDGRSRRGRHEVELRGNSGRGSDTPPVSSQVGGGMEGLLPRIPHERQSRPREQSRTRIRHTHNKGPAPPPPPRRHPNNPSLLLVPTKSGAENARAFYPKESHIIRGNKIVRVEYPGYTSGWMHPDINNNPHHYNYFTPHGSAWMGAAHEYHAVRPRESTISNEMRRRSRSKSPARRPMAHRYIDAVSTFNLSQKLKDISDAVFTGKRNNNNNNNNNGLNNTSTSAVNNVSTTGSIISSNSTTNTLGREAKGHSRSMSTASASAALGGGEGSSSDGTLKSVIKKGRKVEASPQTRRVTFSAYATVQVMEA